MQPEQLVLPTLATIALGAALLVPLRDDRRGKRATLGGVQPMRTEFHALDADRKQRDNVMSVTEPPPQTESDPEITSTKKSESTQLVKPAADTTYVSLAAASHIDEVEPPEIHAPREKRPFSDRLKSFAMLLRFAQHSEPADVASESLAPLEHTRSFASQLDMLLAPNRSTGNQVEPIELPSPEPTSSAETIESEPPSHDVSVVPAQRSPMGRVVPLTRLPLRPQRSSITWTRSLAGIAAFSHEAELAGSDRHLRHALLFSLSDSANEDVAAALHVAFREEDAEGRCLVLRAIMHLSPSAEARAMYVDTLNSGTDDERSIAIDALVRIGERGAILPALNDRLDALAAKAALAYVDSSDRAAYLKALAPHVDRTRIEAILALLAGFVE